MKIRIFIVAIFTLIIVNCLFPQSVPPKIAGNLAKIFFTERAAVQDSSFRNTAFEMELAFVATNNADSLFYVFNANANAGWIIVSAWQNTMPVLAYSFGGTFDTASASRPPAMNAWLESYRKQIAYAIAEKSYPHEEATEQWNYYSNFDKSKDQQELLSISSLLSTTWNQGAGYNAYCPANASGPGGRVWAGCVAVAMAQVMKYWSYPTIGSGSHSYNCPGYGTLSANFGATEYSWGNMPLTTYNSSVALLLYHCGVAVNMNYSSSGSGAYVGETQYNARNALVQYFKYHSSANFKKKSSYSASAWNNLVVAEIDNGRPIIYQGYGADGGHAFVVDGYQTTSYFHVNWGWSGAYDGYFYFSNLAPGSSNFNQNQAGIFSLYPNVPCGRTLSGAKTTGIYEDRCYIRLLPGFSTPTGGSFRARVVPPQ